MGVFQTCALLRHYPKAFGVELAKLVQDQHPPADLRNKRAVNLSLTDKEMFEWMEIGDFWFDADLPALYWYLKKLPTLLERRETRKVGQREEKRTRGAGTKCNVRHGDLSPRRRPFVNVHMHSKCSNICSRNVQKGS